ncbi:MAG: sugar phosphate isomerase/epimerase family protein [Limnochordia bacterium]
MTAKISCLPVSLFNQIVQGEMSLGEWIDFAESCNLDGVDISNMFIANHTPVYLRQLKEMLAAKNIPIVMCTAYPDFTHYDAVQRRRELDYFRRDIALCSQLGISYLRVLAGQAHPETKIEDGVAWAVENIRLAAETADAYGVKLVYEDHAKPGAWDYIDMTYPPHLFLQVVEGIWDSSVGINFDIGNITAYGEDPLEILHRVYPKVETIHVSDMAEKGVFSPVAIGTGVTPLKETFRYLKDRGFQGWLCIEEASNQGLEGIKRVAATVRNLWEEA